MAVAHLYLLLFISFRRNVLRINELISATSRRSQHTSPVFRRRASHTLFSYVVRKKIKSSFRLVWIDVAHRLTIRKFSFHYKDMDGVGEEIIDWRDPNRPHSFYDLTKDAEKILEGIDIEGKVIFSQIKHWPPETDFEDAGLIPTSLLEGGDISFSDSEYDSEEDLF